MATVRDMRAKRYLRAGILFVVLAIGYATLQHFGFIHKSNTCGQHQTVTGPTTVTRTMRIDVVKKEDTYVIAVQGTDLRTGESLTLNTVNNPNNPDQPILPEVHTLYPGNTYKLLINVFKWTDKSANCPSSTRDYVVGIQRLQTN